MKVYDITELFTVKIAQGIYKPGERVDEPATFATFNQVSLGIARLIYSKLCEEGLLKVTSESVYSVTDDQEIIAKARKSLAQRAAKTYLSFANDIGVSSEDALNYVTDSIK